MKKIACLLFLLCCTAMYAEKIKVACVGNSVTYGYLLPARETECYPARLQQMLGEAYEVCNFGKSGTTLLHKGHRPYTQQEEYKNAIQFGADLVIIHLGLNDTDPRNWPNYKDFFVEDYVRLIESFRKANPDCKIWICRMSPIMHWHPRFKSGTRDWYWQIQDAIQHIAAITKTGLIDLQEPLYHRPDLLPDALHPAPEGANLLAETVYKALSGQYGGLQMPRLYTDNMVLQRNQPLRIAGIANAGEKVTVRIAGQKKQTVARPDGTWSVTLASMDAGGPFTLKIQAKSRELSYANVMVGEVWLCSGQSNMAFMLKEAATGATEAEAIRNKKSANDKPSRLRFFDMKARWMTHAVAWDASVLDSLNRLQYYHDTRWQACTPQSALDMSAIAYYFGKMLADSLQVTVGLIHNAIGGSPTESWIDRKTLEFEFPDILRDWTRNDMIQDWVRGRAALNISKASNKQQRHPYEPCYMFESGILPLHNYPLKGVIWYQGESNAHNIELHEILFPLLVKSWRAHWQQELPFYYVQLSSIDRPSWPWFRDSQRRMLYTIPHTGMAVSSDKGDSLNVHPVHKAEIGERLAHWALSKTYDRDLTPSGPLFRSVEFKDNAAYLTFDYGEGMKSADNAPLRTFEIAEFEGLYYPATAEVIDGKIKVTNKQVRHPRFVRYGWQPFTRANLVNGAGLPASTFRSAP